MKYKFLTFLVLIVSAIFFYNVQDVNAMVSCTQSAPHWTPSSASILWTNSTSAVTFEMSQDYSEGWAESVGVLPYTYISTCTTPTPSANGDRCQASVIWGTEYQDFDPCPELNQRLTSRNSPALKIDTASPSCGTSWTDNTTNNTYTLTSASDALSGLNSSNNYTCTATPGNFCMITIKDNTTNPNPSLAGNPTTCQSLTRPVVTPTTYTVTLNAGANGKVLDSVSGNYVTSVSKDVVVSSTTDFTLKPDSNFFTNSSPRITGSCARGNLSSDTAYQTGQVTGDCTIDFSFSSISVTPTTPTGLTASAGSCGTGTINVSWSPVTGATSYTLEKDGVAINANSPYSHTGLVAGSSHSYRVLATNASGSSVYSNAVSATAPVACTTLPSGSLTASSCTIASGASSGNTTLTWSTSNPVGTSNVTSNTPSVNTVIATGNSGTITASVPYNSRTFFLNNNASTLVTTPVSCTCASGTAWNGSTCESTLVINGSCGTSPTHYICDAGTSANNVSGVSTYTWNCIGSGTGHTDASCSETKTAGVDLTASAPTQTTATIGVPLTFSSAISNRGTSTPPLWFNNSFQFASGPNGTGPITPLTAGTILNDASTPMPAGQVRPISASYTFTGAAGTRSVRACADMNTSMTGRITETREDNNCSAWVNVIVSDVSAASGSLSVSNCTIALDGSSCPSTLTWTTTNPIGTSNITSNTPSANTVIATGNSGSTTASVPVATVNYPSRTFFLNNNSLTITSATATASCVAGTGWDGSKCVTLTNPPTCGDGIIESPEACDLGGGNGVCPSACSSSCTINSCVDGVINGACSDPDNHLNPCLSGDSGKVTNGISSWTWSCVGSGVDHTDATCVELKKKPVIIED